MRGARAIFWRTRRPRTRAARVECPGAYTATVRVAAHNNGEPARATRGRRASLWLRSRLLPTMKARGGRIARHHERIVCRFAAAAAAREEAAPPPPTPASRSPSSPSIDRVRVFAILETNPHLVAARCAPRARSRRPAGRAYSTTYRSGTPGSDRELSSQAIHRQHAREKTKRRHAMPHGRLPNARRGVRTSRTLGRTERPRVCGV